MSRPSHAGFAKLLHRARKLELRERPKSPRAAAWIDAGTRVDCCVL
jgi:hypothetical protein